MNKKTFTKTLLSVAGICLVLSLPSTNAFADNRHGRGGGGWSRSLPPRHEVVVVGHDRYHYSDGRFYRPAWFGFGFTIAAPPIGVVVRSLPFGYRTVVIGSSPYYYYDDIYYTSCPSGYVVVPAPVVAQPQPFVGQTITINVPNSSGGYTAVTLVRQGNGYVGPQGEYYQGNPTIEQLRVLYGR